MCAMSATFCNWLGLLWYPPNIIFLLLASLTTFKIPQKFFLVGLLKRDFDSKYAAYQKKQKITSSALLKFAKHISGSFPEMAGNRLLGTWASCWDKPWKDSVTLAKLLPPGLESMQSSILMKGLDALENWTLFVRSSSGLQVKTF